MFFYTFIDSNRVSDIFRVGEGEEVGVGSTWEGCAGQAAVKTGEKYK